MFSSVRQKEKIAGPLDFENLRHLNGIVRATEQTPNTKIWGASPTRNLKTYIPGSFVHSNRSFVLFWRMLIFNSRSGQPVRLPGSKLRTAQRRSRDRLQSLKTTK